MTDKQKVRPILNAVTLNEYGDVDLAELDKMGSMDATYTPGWSEMRTKRAVQEAEYYRGDREAKDVESLPGHLRLVRRTEAGSQDPDVQRATEVHLRGYRPVTKAEVGKVPWMTALPPGARYLPDGTIARGDCVYMFAERQTAALNRARSQRELARQFDQADAWMDAVSSIQGTNPSKSEETGEPIKIQS